jgi:hypothetical protein
MLEWGVVSRALTATIEPNIGGVATPGSRQVCPPESTTYTLTAVGNGGSVSATASITVSAALPDLQVESITFLPNPALVGQDNEVRITFRNAGGGVAGTFAWSWTPGASPPFTGNQAGDLRAGESVLVSLFWQPDSVNPRLPTVARVDTGNSVVETDETNNEMTVDVPVVEPSQVSVVLLSQPQLDGYVPSIGDAVTGEVIRVGSDDPPPNETGYRGFMSFDLSSIPAGATIVSAEVRFYQVRIEGNPFEHLGSFMLEHVDFGPELNNIDYLAVALDSVVLAPQNSPGAWYVAAAEPIVDWIGIDLKAKRTRFQVRLRFSSEIDPGSEPDYLEFESGENFAQSGNLPQLTITYAL